MLREFIAHTARRARRPRSAPQDAPKDVHGAVAEPSAAVPPPRQAPGQAPRVAGVRPKEIGGPDGPEPTRYGDWERKGICVDF
jgi:hypothetical protein